MELKKVFLGVIMLTMVACAPLSSFQSGKQVREGQGEPKSRQLVEGKISLEEYLEELEAVPVDNSKGYSEDGTRYYFSKSFGLNYGLISRVIVDAIRKAEQNLGLPRKCNEDPTSRLRLKSHNSYNCGEVPYGSITNLYWKTIQDIDIPRQIGESDGVKYDVTPIKLRVYSSRQQNRGHAHIQDLTFQGNTKILTSDQLFHSSYLQIKPAQNRVIVSVCSFVPGFRIAVPEAKAYGKFEKKQWGFLKLKAEGDFKIKAGEVNFDYAKVCGAVQVDITAFDNIETQVVGFEKPEFSNLRLEKFNTDIQIHLKGFLKFLNFFTKIFGFDIEKKIAEKANEEIQKYARSEFTKITTEQVESGEWLKMVFEEGFLKENLVKNLNHTVARTLKKEGPGSSLTLSQSLEALCKIVGKGLNPELDALISDVCQDSFTLSVNSFLPDDESTQMGCYNNMFNPYEAPENSTGRRWWAKECMVKNEVRIEAPAALVPLYDCLTQFAEGEEIENIASLCRPEVEYIAEKIAEGKELLDELSEQIDDLKEEVKAQWEDNPENQEYIDRVEEWARLYRNEL